MLSVGAIISREAQAMREATALIIEQSRVQREAITQLLTDLEASHASGWNAAALQGHG